MVNGRVRWETCAVPAQRLETERARVHRLPEAPHTAALGQTRIVNADQTIRFGSVRYSVPPGLAGAKVWVRAEGDELVVVADLGALPLRPAWAGDGPLGLAEVARHALSTLGNPQIDLAHYPGHPQQPDGTPRLPRVKAVTDVEAAFLAIGDGVPGTANPCWASSGRISPTALVMVERCTAQDTARAACSNWNRSTTKATITGQQTAVPGPGPLPQRAAGPRPLGERGAQLRFDRGQAAEAEGEGPVLCEDLWRLAVGQ